MKGCCRVNIIVLLFFVFLQNTKITILTFMNVDGAFILPETHGKTSVLLFVDSRFINDSDQFGKMFVARITLAHAFKKTISVTEQLTSNSVLAQIWCFGLWTLVQRACSALFE